jgi:hypothetical protein
MTRKRQSPEEAAALRDESTRRKGAKAERAERIRSHASANPDLNMADIARAFNVSRNVVEVALGRRKH